MEFYRTAVPMDLPSVKYTSFSADVFFINAKLIIDRSESDKLPVEFKLC